MENKQISNDVLLQLLNIKSKLNSNANLSIIFTENISITFYAEWGRRNERKFIKRIFTLPTIKKSISPLIETFINHVNREMKND